MAINPASLDWATARRVSYFLRQSLRYVYPEPIRDLNHRLVVIPPERFGDQKRLRHELAVDAEGVRFEDRKDRFGNVIIEAQASGVPVVKAIRVRDGRDLAQLLSSLPGGRRSSSICT